MYPALGQLVEINDHQIVVIERLGYGWNDITSIERNLKTVI